MLTRSTGLLVVLVGCALCLAFRLFYCYVGDPLRFPISTVKITASYQHVSHHDIESALEKYLNFSFFLMPIAKLERELKTFAWAQRVEIKRIWPDVLTIKLIEKRPIAFWNNTAITKSGELFNQGPNRDDSLPQLKGPPDQEKEVLQVYKKISKILTKYDLSVASLTGGHEQSFELVLANGIKLNLGKEDIEARVARFCKAYPTLFLKKTEKMATVDLRYPKGMAVRWGN